MTPPALTFDPATRRLSGARGTIELDDGPAMLAATMMDAVGRMIARSDLVDALALPPSIGTAADAVLRGHLRTVRVLVSALSGGIWALRMRGQEAAGLFGPVAPKIEGFGSRIDKQMQQSADVVMITTGHFRPNI